MMLETKGATMRFGGLTAVGDVSFKVRKGGISGLIGPNGAGKTTLIAQLQGELAPDSGHIAFNGADITREPAHRRARLCSGQVRRRRMHPAGRWLGRDL